MLTTERPAGARKTAMPQRVKPMLATRSERIFSSPEWLFEVKWDGVRTLAFWRAGRVRLLSRNLNDVTAEYPEVADGLRESLAGQASAVLDGEIVAFDGGRPSFQMLQQRMHVAQAERARELAVAVPAVYCVFDIIYLDGYALWDCELVERKRLLREAVQPGPHVQVPDEVDEKGEQFFKAITARGMEGVVAKLKKSRYVFGQRGMNWLKFKSTRTLDCVIGGFTEPRGGRAFFGALLLGLYDEGGLRYIGHTGTGFDHAGLEKTYNIMKPLEVDDCPFAERPKPNSPPHWLRPQLVAEVKYAELTSDGKLRHPVFVGLREDIAPEDCRLREEAATARPDRPATHIRLTRKSKVIWPEYADNPAITKEMLAGYYESLADVILPYTRGRPLMLNRYPDGIHGGSFYQKDYTDPVPDGVEVYVYHSRHADREIHHVLCNNRETLLWLAQLACIELNCWTSRIDRPSRPDFIVFDIDPYITFKEGRESLLPSDEDYDAAVEVAKRLRVLLDQIGLAGFLKTSGQTGLHVFAPIRREYGFGQVEAYARTIAEYMLHEQPKLVTTEWNERDRAGKVFFDYSINSRGKTLVGPYSLRPTPAATVSAPIGWDELGRARPVDFTFFSIQQRLRQKGDLWAGILNKAQGLG